MGQRHWRWAAVMAAALLVVGCGRQSAGPPAPAPTPENTTAARPAAPPPPPPPSTEGLEAFDAAAFDPKHACTLLTQADAVRFSQKPLHPITPKDPFRETNTYGVSLCGYLVAEADGSARLLQLTVKRPVGLISPRSQLAEACGSEQRMGAAESLGSACLAQDGTYAILVERLVLVARVVDSKGNIDPIESRSLIETLSPRVREYLARQAQEDDPRPAQAEPEPDPSQRQP